MPEAAVPDGAATKPSNDAQARAATLRLLRVLAAAALLLPVLLFLYASALSYRSTQALANERIDRLLDVMQEQALKAFQSMKLAVDTVNDLVGDRSQAQIAADEPMLHQRLKQMLAALPDVQSIWLFGPDGHPQVITRQSPAPVGEDFSDQDYFRVPRDGYPGVYIGEIHQSVSGGQPYFSFDEARHDAEGKFTGCIEMSLLPSDFSRFYAQLATGPGVRFTLLRGDGVILARFPAVPEAAASSERNGFTHAVAADPAGGLYTSVSQYDHTERRIGFRRIPGYPIYVSAAIATSEIRNEWLGGMALHLIFGVPVTAFLFGALIVVLQRTRRLYAEQDRREAAEAAVRQTQRLDAIGHLTGGVAHDFNNLLTIIMGNLESAQRQLETWSEGAQVRLAQRLRNAMYGAQRAATLTKRLLAFSRQQPLNPTPLDVNRLLNGLSDFLRRALGEEVSLEIVGGAGLWPVEVDAAELETAIINLAVNARDAMPGGGKLTIEASNAYLDDAYSQEHPDVQSGQYVQLAVTDTGAGMTQLTVEHAFEPFFTTKESGQGTGLGLSQVYGFVKQSGGHVKIYSEVGEGSTVKIYLRRFVGALPAQEEIKSEPRRGRAGECVLVVEDDADVRAYVVETLSTLGYAVVEAAEGGQALRVLDQHRVSLLLTDVVMPGMNGRTLADEARQRRPELKVVFMTGYSRNAIVHQGRLDPGVELIQKPLTSEQLAAVIRKVLDA